MTPIEQLTKLFSEFPGIGNRQAKRFVYYLLSKDANFIESLSSLLLKIKNNVSQCTRCARFFTGGKDVLMCDLCSSNNINKKIMMILEKDVDYESMKKSGVYDGRYFILGGVLPILAEDPNKHIRVKTLISEVGRAIKEDGLSEIIFAMSATPEGDNSTQYLLKVLEPIEKKHNVKLSTLGRGFSTGTEVEYSDADTIKNALENRG